MRAIITGVAAMAAALTVAAPAQAAPCAHDPGFPEPPGVWHGQRCVNHGSPADVYRRDRIGRKIAPNEARYEIRQWANGNYPLAGTVPFIAPLDGNWHRGVVNANVKVKIPCVGFGGADYRCEATWQMQRTDGSCWRIGGIVTLFLHNNGNLQVYMSAVFYRRPVRPVECAGYPRITRALASVSSARPDTRYQLHQAITKLAAENGHDPSGPSEVLWQTRRGKRRHTGVTVDTIYGECGAEARWRYHRTRGVTRLRWRPLVLGDAGIDYCGEPRR